jgi:predicted transcriptional regulator
MRELKELEGLKTFFDRRLIEALGHPIREHILAVLNERDASGREIGEELGSDVSAFYHHIEQLEKLGCIERVKTLPKRGAREHVFRARSTVFFDDEALRNLPTSLRSDLTTSFVQRMFDEVARSLTTRGALSRDSTEHISWRPAQVDRQGWREATSLLDETLQRLNTILEQSSARLADGAEPTTMSVAMLAFETGPGGEGKASTETAPEP